MRVSGDPSLAEGAALAPGRSIPRRNQERVSLLATNVAIKSRARAVD